MPACLTRAPRAPGDHRGRVPISCPSVRSVPYYVVAEALTNAASTRMRPWSTINVDADDVCACASQRQKMVSPRAVVVFTPGQLQVTGRREM
jgi:hypothetical protein